MKLPIGEIKQPAATLDMSQSVENEYFCLLIARELGFEVPTATIVDAGSIRALAVERFDRRWVDGGRALLRLPQEDICQALGLPSAERMNQILMFFVQEFDDAVIRVKSALPHDFPVEIVEPIVSNAEKMMQRLKSWSVEEGGS